MKLTTLIIFSVIALLATSCATKPPEKRVDQAV